ncbi:MAG: transcription-repair coupling factor [Thermoanaerobaculia bacterium]
MSDTQSHSLVSELRAAVAASATFTTLRERLAEGRVEVTGASPEARALIAAALQENQRSRIAIVVPNDAPLADLEAALRLFSGTPEQVASYPNPSLSPYQEVPPSLAVTRSEIRTLGQLLRGRVDFLLVPARALFLRIPDPEEFLQRIIAIREGEELDLQAVLAKLVENGFARTDLVGEVGEFAFRGGILDVYPPNCDAPLRIELFGDTIESIREFEPDTQRSAERVAKTDIYPAIQFPMTRPTRASIARRLSLDFQDPIYRRDVAEKIERINEHGGFPGVEHYAPVAVESVPLTQHLRAQGWMIAAIEPDETISAIDRYETLLRTEYDTAVSKGRAVYAPERFVVPAVDIHDFLGHATLAFSSVHVRSGDYGELRIAAPATQRFVNRLSELPAELAAGRASGNRQVLFVATKGGREKVERLFREFSIPYVDGGTRLEDDIVIAGGSIAAGFDFPDAAISVLSEWDLFEPPTSTRLGGRRRSAEAFVTDLRDLKPGDYIVHVDHGVGRFVGLRRIPFGEAEREVMELEYGNAGKLLLPMESLNLIQKYSGGAEAPPKLDKLGGTSWARTKASVKKAMRDMADELLKLYATRQMVKGHSFGFDTPWQGEFEEAFEFDETDDQTSAIEDIKQDMESKKPMDRLLCGDVGYGKTEVAMRAAFKAVMDGKQVAVLAPTTVLAYQHYRTFLRRFASFPAKIELLSRYWSAKDQKEIIRKLESGEIDIVVGTHRIISKDILFKDLGLLVIDEEQRFGVGQKERLKQLKKSVDVLAMSATPIPRTLHMSLVGIRDISVIETPPKDRLAIQTAVVPFNDEFVREAIEFETARGGQVFFIHNRVESIYAMKEHLERLVPGLRVIIGHGQMEERELEKAMMAFIGRDFDVLLATTIIENGIDIPACNTILINHAERFGLSQLYQLRGRVGRSDRLAFCYLLVPSDRVLSSDARKRLAAIQEFSDLGAGFRIAARDLEIRGAGNLLGGEQSGQIAAVGFEMYTKLLEETVRELRGEKVEEEVETTVNLGVDIYIPRDYIGDETLRMTFYKRVASARDEARLREIRAEIRDRFGALPDNVEALFDFVRLKLLAKTIGVTSIAREGSTVAMKFQPSARIDPNRLLAILHENPQAKFSPSGVLAIPVQERGRPMIGALEALLVRVAAAA